MSFDLFVFEKREEIKSILTKFEKEDSLMAQTVL